MSSNRVKIELHHFEFKALKANRMISGICSSYLASAKRQGDYMVLDISILEAKDLAGWVAAEANHAKTEKESDLLNSACDAVELYL